MAQQMSVRLNKGDAPSLGFRLQGGIDFGTPLVIQKVNLGSPAEKAGLVVGDSLVKINGTDVYNLRHKDAQDVIIRAGPSFEITVQRGGTSTWKPSVTPLPKAATPTSFSPVTKTSLAAKPQPSIGSIGTGHNLSAKPFSPQLNGAVNGGPKLVNKQYNSPLGLYSEQSIAETLSAQAEVLSTGVLGVNFKKNEKNYDASNSAVFRMVHEADKEPRDQEPVNRQNFYATHSHAIGGYTTTPRSNTPLSERSNSRQGLEEHMQKPGSCDEQTTTCNECDRVIVGVFVRIKDKNLHVECFKCATCGSSLKNVGYYNINNKLYCDVHAKLAAKSAAPASNLVPVTVLPPGKAPAGTISAALATHPLPTVPPSSGSSNITAQPFQGGNFPSPRPFSSVSAPLSPPVNNYSTLPKASPTSPPFVPSAPAAQGHSLHNIIWPPPPNSEELELPTATPLYLPPPTHLKVLTRASIFEDKKDKKSLEISKNIGALDSLKTKDQKGCSEIEDRKLLNTEETHNVTRDMETRMSICSKEVTNITQRQLAVERIEAATETQSIVESVLQQRPKSPSPSDEYLQPKVKVETAALSRDDFSETLKCNIRASANSPRVVTKVCVCTNPCCEANNGELCENCPMKTVGKSKNDSKSKLKPTEIELPKRYGSPIITGVSVTINNPGKIKESATDLFTQIPEKKTTSALGSALVTTPKEPFIPASATYSGKSVPLPEATEPYLPPEKHVAQEEKPPKPRCIKTQEHDTPMVSALRIAPDQPFTPVNTPAPSKKKKPKEDPLLADLPKPKQWMSMVSALTTTPEKPFSLAVNESSTEKQTVLNKLEEEEVTKIKESQEKKSKSSIVNTTVLPKPFEQLKSKPVETSKTVPEVALLPTATDLKSQYHYDIQQTQEKREMLSQRTEQSCLIKKECKEEHKEQKHEEKLIECSRISGKSEKSKKIIVEKQAEQTILKKPLELTNYLQKREYLPQYQMSLNYDETIQLPHHKDIKKLLPDGQSKQESKGLSRFATTQEWSKEATSSHFLSESTKQSTASTRPLLTVQDDTKNVFRPVVEDKLPSTSFSPRPKLLTPSVINNPAPILPYYQERLVPTQMPPPEINILDPKSPAVSRSPSPCPDRAPSPFKSPSPRPISPAPGPPPNPLRTGEVIPKFTKDYYKMENAKKSISEYIPHYREKVEGIECIKYPEKSPSNTHATSIKSYEGNKCYTTTALDSQTCMGVADVKQCIHSSKASDVSSLTEQNIEKLKKSTSEVHQTCSMFKVQKTNIAAVGNVNKHLENTQRASQSCTQLRQPLPESQCSTSNPEHTNIHHVNYSQSNTGPTVGSSVSTVPKPNTGSSGGRQPGAIGVTPKRGRGILNVGGLIGSRVAVCGHCHSQIRGPFITALGKIWCPEHFICNTPSCRRQLQDLGFVEEQGQLYCEYCFEQYIAPPCAKCSAKIKGDCLRAIGKNFHPECFSCSYCGKLFGNSPFFLEDAQPYCENDWNELFTTKCFACGFPVEAGDRWVEALNNNYHSQCFNCTMCKKNLEGQSFFAKGGRPFCKNHAR